MLAGSLLQKKPAFFIDNYILICYNKSMKNNKHKPTMTAVVDARREGQYVRAKTWSKKGKSKCPKALRRKFNKLTKI